MQETSVVKCRSDFLKDYRAYLKPFLLLSDLMRKQVANNLLDAL